MAGLRVLGGGDERRFGRGGRRERRKVLERERSEATGTKESATRSREARASPEKEEVLFVPSGSIVEIRRRSSLSPLTSISSRIERKGRTSIPSLPSTEHPPPPSSPSLLFSLYSQEDDQSRNRDPFPKYPWTKKGRKSKGRKSWTWLGGRRMRVGGEEERSGGGFERGWDSFAEGPRRLIGSTRKFT